MARNKIALCKKAAELNYSASNRKGNILHLSNEGKLIITGDLHGHVKNFQRIITYADLENNPHTHLVLQEILHGGKKDEFGGCLSFKLFFEILQLQLKYPNRVHLIMGNHDTAIITDSNVTKDGREMNRAMKDALKRYFGDDSSELLEAIKEYLLSQALAIKTSTGIWISHSLPSDRFADDFDTDVFDTELFPFDLERPEPVYLLTWGRKQSPQKLQQLANLLNTDFFILGHQKPEQGYLQVGDNTIIMTSEHNHGCILPIDLQKQYGIQELVQSITPLASISVE